MACNAITWKLRITWSAASFIWVITAVIFKVTHPWPRNTTSVSTSEMVCPTCSIRCAKNETKQQQLKPHSCLKISYRSREIASPCCREICPALRESAAFHAIRVARSEKVTKVKPFSDPLNSFIDTIEKMTFTTLVKKAINSALSPSNFHFAICKQCFYSSFWCRNILTHQIGSFNVAPFQTFATFCIMNLHSI